MVKSTERERMTKLSALKIMFKSGVMGERERWRILMVQFWGHMKYYRESRVQSLEALTNQMTADASDEV